PALPARRLRPLQASAVQRPVRAGALPSVRPVPRAPLRVRRPPVAKRRNDADDADRALRRVAMARPDKLNIALAQINLLVGDVRGNLARVIEAGRRARDVLKADLVLFPELTLSGYPPEDLLFHRGLRRQIAQALEELKLAVPEIGLVV